MSSITYNEKHQRVLATFGSGVTTAYGYDPLTFRLTSLVTQKGNAVLQDLSYTYDAVGNITQITDAADGQDTIYFSNQVVKPAAEYGYDTLYRLVSAKGREDAANAGGTQGALPDESDFLLRTTNVLPENNTAMVNFTETYAYDLVGNFSSMTHKNGNATSWSRAYAYAAGSNRLASTTVGQSTSTYTHDAAGNMTVMPHLPTMDWDDREQLVHCTKGVGATDEIYFVYDASGQRVRKLVFHVPQGGSASLQSERVYVGGDYEFYRESAGGGLERETVHVMDDQRRVALIEQLTLSGGAAVNGTPVVRDQHDNHLGTACVETDASGNVISYEEYLPYGASSYRAAKGVAAVSLKRYRYTGKERDEETGLSYHGARYLATWLGRWCSADPLCSTEIPYGYASCNPLSLVDPDGAKPTPPASSGPIVEMRNPIPDAGDIGRSATYALNAARIVAAKRGQSDVSDLLKSSLAVSKPNLVQQNTTSPGRFQLTVEYRFEGEGARTQGPFVGHSNLVDGETRRAGFLVSLPSLSFFEQVAYTSRGNPQDRAKLIDTLARQVFHETVHILLQRDTELKFGSESKLTLPYRELLALARSERLVAARKALGVGDAALEAAVQEFFATRATDRAFGDTHTQGSIGANYAAEVLARDRGVLGGQVAPESLAPFGTKLASFYKNLEEAQASPVPTFPSGQAGHLRYGENQCW